MKTYRICKQCKKPKPLVEFCRDKTNAIGRAYICVSCKREYMRKRREQLFKAYRAQRFPFSF